jgi:2-methylisocitrate lyase-like PEP mutase family enzyme
MLNLVNGGVTPLVDANEAARLGYKLVIWPIFALMSAYQAYDKAAAELKAGFLKDQEGYALRDVFELCGLSKYVAFDEEMGGKMGRA